MGFGGQHNATALIRAQWAANEATLTGTRLLLGIVWHLTEFVWTSCSTCSFNCLRRGGFVNRKNMKRPTTSLKVYEQRLKE